MPGSQTYYYISVMRDFIPLIERTIASDLKLFGQLVRQFQDIAVGYAHAILSDFYLAQDAAQEAFVEAYRNLSHLRNHNLSRLVSTHCVQILRPTHPATAFICCRFTLSFVRFYATDRRETCKNRTAR